MGRHGPAAGPGWFCFRSILDRGMGGGNEAQRWCFGTGVRGGGVDVLGNEGAMGGAREELGCCCSSPVGRHGWLREMEAHGRR